MLELAQSADTLGFLQTLLDGGLPLLLLTALCLVGYLYKKEKEAKDVETAARVAAVEKHSREISELKTDYSSKVEELLRERLKSETAAQKLIIETKEISKSVVMSLNNVQDLLESIIEEET